jgi:metal-sulfur cluster biosynthetic enzyme/rhodanese-related sulfurtransferase
MQLVLVLVVVALAILASRLHARLADAERKLGDLRLLRRELDEAKAETQRALAVTRQHLVEVAAGTPPPRDVVLKGTAWRAMEPAPALVHWQQHPDLYVLDVRTPAEFAAGHIPNAHLVPLDELEDRLGELPAKDAELLVTCAAGGRSTQACQILADRGWTRLLNLAGGMHAWTGPKDRDESLPPPPPAAASKTGTEVTFRGGAVSQEQVLGALRECFDPEIPLNVYDLGLVYGVDIGEDAIAIKMTLTSEGCPSARQIPEDVKRRVAALGQPNVNVEVVFDPPWHPARISADGKEKLGLA